MAEEQKIRNGLVVYTKGAGTTVLDIQGTAGQLAHVDDSMTGLIHYVGDISGIRILEVFSDGRVFLNFNLILSAIPTASTGLPAGSVWRSGNDLKIV